MEMIIGGGLAGLICAALNASAEVYEANPRETVTHRAVLRFRDDRIARALGLAFRPVVVRKAIWYNGAEVTPSPRLANMYSWKVRGALGEVSLWSALEPAQRYIAPDNLHELLADICGARVHWDTKVDWQQISTFLHTKEKGARIPIISTIPLPILLSITRGATELKFQHAPIYVNRYLFPEGVADVFQTIYFPDPKYSVYRATITGRLFTVESNSAYKGEYNDELEEVRRAFGLPVSLDCEPLDIAHKQTFGKIVPVHDATRKALLHQLTTQYGIYSLGRFATWRNILLDDVFDDIAAIRRMINLSTYDATLARSREEGA